MDKAAEKNYSTLMRKYGGRLTALLEAQQDSMVGYGSEFRDVGTLSKMFEHHPNWMRMSQIRTNGLEWPLKPLNKENRLADVREALSFGNHKGALMQPDILLQLMSKDVHFGYCPPLPLAKAEKIPDILIAPMNIQQQNTINEYGQIIPKDHQTHDQSFKWSLGTSVNSRVKTEELLLCMFGACIKRIVNWAVTARQLFPNVPILASMIDFKSAFQRCHLNVTMAVQTCTQLVKIGILLTMLRLSIGGKPCPSEWGIISETICNLANAILHNNDWDPDKLFAPNQHLVPALTLLDDNTPFAEGAELIVDIPINPRGMHDLYIDDIIGLTVDIPGTNYVAHGQAAALLAIDTTAQPNHPEEPIPRKSMDAKDKLIAEVGPTKTKIILGWDFDFRRLLISLLENKFIAWMTNIRKLLVEGSTTAKELESTIRQLGHLALVVSGVHNFLSRLCKLQQQATHCRLICRREPCWDDLLLMLHFIDILKQGIDMNLVAFCQPTHIYRSNSCPFGLRGYLDEGFAWHFEIPEDLRFRASNKLLKCIGSIVLPWVDMLAGCLKQGDCALLMTDSSRSAGWLCKTNFREIIGEDADPVQAKVHIKMGRHHATLFLKVSVKEYSQWFPGWENNVVNALSQDFDCSDDELTHILRETSPLQLPQHFQIVPLPNKISLWLTSLLQKLPMKEQLREAHTRTTLGRGTVSQGISKPLASATTSSLTPSQDLNETRSSELFPWLSGRDNFWDQLMTPWLWEQSEIPSWIYLQPSGETANQTQPRTMTSNLASSQEGKLYLIEINVATILLLFILLKYISITVLFFLLDMFICFYY
jgi:hypothetical protein